MAPRQYLSRSLLMSFLLLINWSTVQAGVRLVDAIKSEDRSAIRLLVRQGTEVNTPEPDGTTALHWAAYMDDAETADLLIRAGAKVNAANRHGVTPLSLACLIGNTAMLEMLLKAGADPNAAVREGETALMTVARSGKADGVKVLLSHGANVNAKESWRGQTALMWAAAEGHAATIQALVDGGADVSARSNAGFTALLFAVREGKVDAVRALLKAGADINDNTMWPPANGRFTFVPTTQPAPGGPSALVLAVGSAHFELASVLLDAGADPNVAPQGWTALHQLTWVRKTGFGDNPPPRGSGNMDSLELVRRLVAHGANVNARMTRRANMGETDLNNIGTTPFLLAARTKDLELMRLLIQLGADPLLPNADKTTPLMVAAGVGTTSPGDTPGTDSEGLEAVKLIWELGGDVNAVDDNGETAMHGAAYKHYPSVVRFLAEKGANVEVWTQKNKIGWSPLMIAEGVRKNNNIHSSVETAAAIREVMNGAPANANQPK